MKVAAMYQEMIDDGAVSGAVFYNQGNAWMRAKQPGRAIAAYRQAQRYRPRDPYLDANLQYALGPGVSARRPMIRNHSVLAELAELSGKVLRRRRRGASLTFCFAVIMLFTSRRRLWRRLVLAGAAVTALLIVSAAYDWYRFDYVVRGVITQADVVARKGNAESYEPALNEKLSEGTEFRLLERRGDWLLIRLPGGQEGWITGSGGGYLLAKLIGAMTMIIDSHPAVGFSETLLVVFAELSIMYSRVSIGLGLVFYRHSMPGVKASE